MLLADGLVQIRERPSGAKASLREPRDTSQERIALPVSTSQRRTAGGPLLTTGHTCPGMLQAPASVLPSGENAIFMTHPLPSSRRTSLPLFGSNKRMI